MVKVEGAKNFGIGLGLIVEDALFAVRLDFTIFQVEIECEGSIFLHDDQVTVIDLGLPSDRTTRCRWKCRAPDSDTLRP